MKNTRDYRDGTYEAYLAYHFNKKMASLQNIKVNGKEAQQVDFYKAEHPDGTTMYFIAIVFRGHKSDYYNKKTWLEERYLVTKDEGNQIYTEAKKSRELNNAEVITY